MTDQEIPTDEQADERPRIEVKSLKDIGRRDVTIEIEHRNEILVFQAKTLTFKRFQELGRLVDAPQPPAMGVDANKRPLYNLNDPGYKKQVDEAENRRGLLRLAEFLDMDIPGETPQEKADALAEALEQDVVISLFNAMWGTVVEGKARVEARAATFHRNGTGTK